MADQALFTLLHVLVFVYWLGGDLGAFYTSRFLIQPDVSADRRLLAAKIVNDVDMAPRSALILTLPTGLALAESKAWVSIGWPAVIAVSVGAALWLMLAWYLHLKHGAVPEALRKLDLGVRWVLVLGLGGWAIGGLTGSLPLPVFIALKLLALVGCILLGVLIRTVLKPLGPALMGLSGPDSTAAATSLAQTLNRARPLVTCIWALLIIAAFLGLWTPTTF